MQSPGIFFGAVQGRGFGVISMKVKAQKKGLYISLLIVSSGLLIIGLGPGLFNHPDLGGYSWQHMVFDPVCHQIPERSFSINGQSMAVCSRSLGIYGGFAVMVLLMPLIPRFFTVINSLLLKLIIASIVVNFVDVLVNYFSIWSNTLHSRFWLGASFGVSLALYLTNEFFKRINTQENYYGE